MVLPYAEAWSADNEGARSAQGRLWVVLGDSTAQGIGASTHRHGYVDGVLAWLGQQTGEAWRVVNLSRSGARAADVLAEQLPALAALDERPALVTLAVGANDILRRTPLPRLEATLTAILDRLPAGSVVANLPQGLGRGRPPAVNGLLTQLAAHRGFAVADLWSRTGPPWAGKFAADGFHPNDAGYREWTTAFTDALAASGAHRPAAPAGPSNRWLRSQRPVGADYDRRFEEAERAGKDVHGEATLVASVTPAGGSVLDAGCGTGRVGIELARRGYQVVGVDLDTGMLDAARAKAPEIAWVVADLAGPELASLLDRTFDTVVAAGNVMIFLEPGTEGAVVANLAGMLRPGGLLVAGFQLDGHLPLGDYDRHCHHAGLEPVERWATWDRQRWQEGGPYAVSVHRRSNG